MQCCAPCPRSYLITADNRCAHCSIIHPLEPAAGDTDTLVGRDCRGQATSWNTKCHAGAKYRVKRTMRDVMKPMRKRYHVTQMMAAIRRDTHLFLYPHKLTREGEVKGRLGLHVLRLATMIMQQHEQQQCQNGMANKTHRCTLQESAAGSGSWSTALQLRWISLEVLQRGQRTEKEKRNEGGRRSE
jgi:hypothetical protein